MSFWRLPTRTTKRAQVSRAATTHLSGQWLTLTRVTWIILVLLILVYFSACLPETFIILHQPCSGVWCTNASGRLTASQIQALAHAGISLDAYAWSWIILDVITALIWIGVGGILFWRKSTEWMVLLVALMLISVGADGVTNVLLYSSSLWRFSEYGLYLIQGQATLCTLALFPNGRFVPRWSFWVTLIYPASIVCYLAFLRPLRLPGWALYSSPLNAITWFGSWTILALAQLYRYFRVSNAVERQQTKWVAFGFLVVLVIGLVASSLGDDLSTQHNGLLYALSSIGSSFFILPLLLAFVFALLRSHLWDIDIIINRTLVYGGLSALLASVYFGLVFALQSLIQAHSGQNVQPIVIVASTLVVAALFQPLRRRIQAIIDRRFYRSKYDATRALAAFEATLHSQMDLEMVSERLVTVVQETMQPAYVSLWLLQPGKAAKQQEEMISD